MNGLVRLSSVLSNRLLWPGPVRAALLLAVFGVLGVALPGEVGAQVTRPEPTEAVALSEVAAQLDMRHGKRKTTGRSAEKRLPLAVRVALNEWADDIVAHDLQVHVPKEAHAVLLGRADGKSFAEASGVLDETWELVAPLLPEDEDGPAVLVFLFDREAMDGEAWGGVLDALVERNELVAYGADNLRRDPGPLMLRALPGFLQPSFDMAGDAAAGDDEFRLANEVAHKFTQCLLKSRHGEVPGSIRWGLGFVVEQRQFRSIYQMNHSGFVASADHFDWPKKARSTLLDAAKDDGFSLADLALDEGAAGTPAPPQMLTWAALDYLHAKDPDGLRSLLDELGALHAEGAGRRVAQDYLGDADATRELLAQHLDGVDSRKLASHLKRLK